MHKSARLPVAWKSIAKYVLAAAIMGLILYVTPYPTTLLLTLVKTGVGLGIYIGLLLAIDKQARKLLSLIVAEIKNSVNAYILKRNNNHSKSPAETDLSTKN
jgi:hypothetical protein